MSIFVARQPIFDAGDKLRGYELLYREDGVITCAGDHDSNTMSARVIANVFLSMDIRELTGNVPGFVNITREQLLERTYALLNPADVVIELLETCVICDKALAALRELTEAGYTLALDDFELTQSNPELLAMASIVKIDVFGRPDEDLVAIIDHLKPYDVELLAERVETKEVYDRCRALGFGLFQGYFHARPETVHSEDAEARRSSTFRLLNLLRDPASTDAQIEDAFSADPVLCYKLMRIVNSAATGVSVVDSVRHGLRVVGRGTLYRWLSVLFTASFAVQGDTAKELVVGALARGRLCELMANRSAGALSADAMFMTGLLSRMHLLLGVSKERVLTGIQVSNQVRDALLLRTGAQAPVLILAEAYDEGDWRLVKLLSERIGLATETVSGLYVDSIRWAENQFARQAA